jgi:HSP20 family protein
MANLMRRNRPSTFNLRRDIDDVLEEFTSPRALRREIDRLFGEDLSPRSMLQEMDRLFDDFVSPVPMRRRISALLEPFRSGGAMFVPNLELVERDNEYALNVDLPGVRQEDVQVSVDDDNVLSIRGERRDEKSSRSRGYEYTERSYGSFSRSVELPRGVDASKIEADYRDGVLELRIPKTEQAMARQIPVRSREQGRELGQGGEQGREQTREQPRVMGPGNEGGGQRDARTQANSR